MINMVHWIISKSIGAAVYARRAAKFEAAMLLSLNS